MSSKSVMLTDTALSAIIGSAGDKRLLTKILDNLEKEHEKNTVSCAVGLTGLFAIVVKEVVDNMKSDVQGFKTVIDGAYPIETDEEKLEMLNGLDTMWSHIGAVSAMLTLAHMEGLTLNDKEL